MSSSPVARPSPVESASVRRSIGGVRGARGGACLICIGALHGNEPAGVQALERVFERIEADGIAVSGAFIGLIGNTAAYRTGRRYIDRDLNRLWDPERFDGADADCPEGTCVEHEERRALWSEIQRVQRAARGPVHLLDLHTTSSESAPFTIANDRRANRRFAAILPVPVAFGLQEEVGGTLMEFVQDRGMAVTVFEAGAHNDTESVDRHEAAIWLALAGLGIVRASDVPGYVELQRLLTSASRGLPRRFGVRYRHPVTGTNGFRMKPGYVNFDRVRSGEVLADHHGALVRAVESGMLFMPLYQGLGHDGFYLVRALSRGRLLFGAMLRLLHVDRLARILPGVRRHPTCRVDLLVDPRFAGAFGTELFHLLGYRRHPDHAGRIVFRRKADLPED